MHIVIKQGSVLVDVFSYIYLQWDAHILNCTHKLSFDKWMHLCKSVPSKIKNITWFCLKFFPRRSSLSCSLRGEKDPGPSPRHLGAPRRCGPFKERFRKRILDFPTFPSSWESSSPLISRKPALAGAACGKGGVWHEDHWWPGCLTRSWGETTWICHSKPSALEFKF